jgi:hypothetical protein
MIVYERTGSYTMQAPLGWQVRGDQGDQYGHTNGR